MRRRALAPIGLFAWLLVSAMARAQGGDTGAIVGHVYDQSGNPIRGVKVVARSPTQLSNQVPGGMNGRIRGASDNQTLFLQDGFELNQSNGVYPVLKSSAAFEISVSGYGAVGATASGGMINLVTRTGSNKLEAEIE